MKERILVLTAIVLLTLLMIASFVGLPWNETAVAIDNRAVAQYLFENFAFSLVVIALLLAVTMVGGVYLARRDEEEELP